MRRASLVCLQTFPRSRCSNDAGGACNFRPAPGVLSRGLTFPVELRAAHENVRRFVPGGELATTPTAEASVFAGVAGARGMLRWAIGPIGVGWYSGTTRDWRTTGGVRARLTTPPRAGATRLELTADATGDFWGTTFEASRTFERLPFSIRPFVGAAWGERLPLHRTAPLGGAQGFPGLRITEWRSERAAMVGTAAEWAVLGPVAFELELAAASTAQPGVDRRAARVLDADQSRVIWGGRLGLRIETPAGPIRIAEGVNSLGRHALFLRLGRWY
jgi:hypothetical protein